MDKKLFFIDYIKNDIIYLDKDETNHLVNVLKMKKNDIIYLTDGNGNIWKALISNIYKKKVELLSIKKFKNYKKKNYIINLYITPSKSFNRFKWFLEKSVEIGVNKITPIISNNSEKKFFNIDRAIKIIRSSVKQSFRSYMPILKKPLNYDNFIKEKSIHGIKYIAHCNKNFKRYLLKNIIPKNINNIYNILIGPEGDFTFEEITVAMQYNWIGVELSEHRLRNETAAIVFLSAISLFN